jgi:hypothetical protein
MRPQELQHAHNGHTEYVGLMIGFGAVKVVPVFIYLADHWAGQGRREPMGPVASSDEAAGELTSASLSERSDRLRAHISCPVQ